MASHNWLKHYDRAVGILGSERQLALACGLTQQTLWRYRRRGCLPAEAVVAIERVTNGAVTRAQLRPDLWGPTDPPLTDAPFHMPPLQETQAS